MFELKINTSRGATTILSDERKLAFSEIIYHLENKGFPRESFYIVQNGRLLTDNCTGQIDGSATLVPRIFGGKGGFGSMLRAIGAQIEKTTNREACRDLSGRRLRDINEEKRLKAWIEKQETREEEEVQRKKRKLEKLCAVPKHEFKDKKYEEERSCLTDRVCDALDEGFKMAAAAAIVAEAEKTAKQKIKKIGRKTILDDDFDSDELDTSSDEDDADGNEENVVARKKIATSSDKASLDSGCSSDEASKVCADSSSNHQDDSSKSATDDNSRENSTNSNEKNATENSSNHHDDSSKSSVEDDSREKSTNVDEKSSTEIFK